MTSAVIDADGTRAPGACIVSGADEIRLRSYVNHSIYAQMHGLDYRLECGIAEGVRNKFFYKTSIIARVLPRYDWIVWMDDDTFVTDFSRDTFRELIAEAENDDRFLVLAEGPLEPNGFWSVINTGVMILRNCPESFEMLRMMDDANLDRARDWWDEDRHGVFTGGDQDLVVWWLETNGLMGRVRIVDHRTLNSRGHYYEDSLSDAFVMHFCGYPDKEWGVVRFAKRFGIGQELVPDELLDRFSVRVRSPMSDREFARRDFRTRTMSRVKKELRPHYHRLRSLRSRRAGS